MLWQKLKLLSYATSTFAQVPLNHHVTYGTLIGKNIIGMFKWVAFADKLLQHKCWIGYIGECMVSTININNGIKGPTRGYQNCNTNQILVLSGYVNVRGSLYTQVIIWVSTILYHIDTRLILPRYDSSCMIYTPKWNRRKKIP